jgi:F420-non-reducing hydrogenase large subunit
VSKMSIDPLTRIEGQSRVILQVDDAGAVSDAFFQVMELRGFEKFITGMEIEQMPFITSRICGICSVSHSLASCKAIDAMFGVEPPRAGKMLRELLGLASLIHSHALHFFYLASPDIIMGIGSDPAARNVFGLFRAQPQLVRDAVKLSSLAARMVEMIGARGIHQVTAVGGGMAYKPSDSQRQELLDIAGEALELGKALGAFGIDLLGGMGDLIDMFQLPSLFMGTVKGGRCNLYDGALRVVDTTGVQVAEFPAAEYERYIEEQALPFTYLKATYFDDGGELNMYQVGSLARLNVTESMETPLAQEMLAVFRDRYGRIVTGPVLYNYARLVELVYACEKAVGLLEDDLLVTGEPRVPLGDPTGRLMRGVGQVEAPGGVLIHEYESDESGRISKANLIVATQQNNLAINKMLKNCASAFGSSGVSQDAFLNAVEFIIRCFDPCLSCATHAVGHEGMQVVVARDGEVIKRTGRW